MKSHVKRSPQRSLLGREVLGAVLAHERDAGLGQRAHAPRPRRTWSRRAISTSVRVAARPAPPPAAISSRTRRGCARTRSASSPRSAPPRHSRLPAGHSRRRGGGRRTAPSPAHIVHRPTSWTSPTPAASSSRRAIALRSTLRPSSHAGAVARERGVDLLADLVAAAARARARSPPRSARRAQLAQRAHALGDDAAGQPAPARSAASRPPRGATSATGRQSATSTIGATPRAAPWPGRRRAAGSPARSAAVSARTCAPWTWRPCAKRSRGDAHLRRDPLAVLEHALALVVGPQARGSASCTGPSDTPAAAGGEQHARRRADRCAMCSPAQRKPAQVRRPRRAHVTLQLEPGDRLALGVLEVRAAGGDEPLDEPPAPAGRAGSTGRACEAISLL